MDTNSARKSPLRLLNLILYSPSACYDEMREALREHHRRNCGADRDTVVVRHLFYWYDESLLAPFELRGADELVLRGRESVLPGIMHKTVRAIELATSGALGAECAEADFVVRTNVSSVCDFQGIARALRAACGDCENDNDYIFCGGPSLLLLNWQHYAAGIMDDRLAGLIFAHGTCITLSRAACRALVREQRYVDWTVIDDVSLGVFFRDRGGVHKLDGELVYGTGVPVVPGALVYRHATHHLGEEARFAHDVPNMRTLVAAWPRREQDDVSAAAITTTIATATCEQPRQQQLDKDESSSHDKGGQQRRRRCCCCS